MSAYEGGQNHLPDIPAERWREMYMDAAAELERLRADLARAEARIDYIQENARSDPRMDGQHVWWPTSFNHRLIGPNLREAIDAAIENQTGAT